MIIKLEHTSADDILLYYQFEKDLHDRFQAAFTSKMPLDFDAYKKKWEKLLLDPSVLSFSIWNDEAIVGYLAKFQRGQEVEVTYWIGRKYQGRGFATNALKRFLEICDVRPLYGRTAFDNLSSQRVLTKVGFKQVAEDVYFAEARGKEIKEIIYRLDL